MSKESTKNAINETLAKPFSSFGPLIKATRKVAGVTAAKYAKAAEIHINSQSNYENSKRDPSVDYLIHFCSSVGVSFWQMMYRRVELSDAPEFHKQHILQEIAPFYPHLIDNSSNTPAISPDNPRLEHKTEQSEEVIDACYQMMASLKDKPNIKVVKQNGNAMAPTLGDGDILFVDTNQTNLTEGDIFVFELLQDQTAKRVQLLPNGGIMLIADNANYHPMNISSSDVAELKVLGKLITSICQFS